MGIYTLHYLNKRNWVIGTLTLCASRYVSLCVSSRTQFEVNKLSKFSSTKMPNAARININFST